MKFAKLLVAALAVGGLIADVASASVKTQVDKREDVLTEHLLRNNEAYFFYLFNNGRPAPEHANILLEVPGDFYLTDLRFSDGTIKLVYERGNGGAAVALSEIPHICAVGVFDTIQPFPHRWRKLSRKEREGGMFRHDFSKLLIATRDNPACLYAPAGVSIVSAHRYLVTKEMRETIRRWYWEKVGDTARLTESR